MVELTEAGKRFVRVRSKGANINLALAPGLLGS
jgi:hypothetical protein